jgi:pyruvate/2-oxoglutarate dehydrogenase complex dihydrolipoamide acyltransferase (E2) component
MHHLLRELPRLGFHLVRFALEKGPPKWEELRHQRAMRAARERRAADEKYRERLEEIRHEQAMRAAREPRVRATVAARRRAEELGVDLSKVKSSEGPGGLITLEDVNRAVKPA